MTAAAKLLHEIMLDKDIQHCLECLNDNGNIILWLKDETKGLIICGFVNNINHHLFHIF